LNTRRAVTWLQVFGNVAEFEPPFGGAQYLCLLWDSRGGRSVDELSRLSRALIASGIRYAVCGGVECERWHTDEPPEEVAFFFIHNTNFNARDFTRFLVLQLGGDWPREQQLRAAIREHALEPEDDEAEESWLDRAV
jgi:hypothetical protein